MRTKLICSVTSVLALGLAGSAAGQGLKGEYFNNMTLLVTDDEGRATVATATVVVTAP
jgi:hypothetical protein